MTDLAWSPDGKFLAASSHDGYCTLASFAPGDLGMPLKDASTVTAAALRAEITAKRSEQVRICVLLREMHMICVCSQNFLASMRALCSIKLAGHCWLGVLVVVCSARSRSHPPDA